MAVDHSDHMHIEPQTAIEGEDITLTCRATRYLYSELQWFDPQNRTVTADVSRNGGTPAYRCGALNHFKHKSAHKTFVLNVDGKQSTRESRSGSTATTRGRAFGASQELFWL